MLGSGHYGVLYKGRMRVSSLRSAVKTVRRHPYVPIEHFKALLSELKQHENTDKLIAAYSTNIKTRELYLVVKFCKISLLHYLRDGAPANKDRPPV